MKSKWKEENVQLWPKSICSSHASTWLHLAHSHAHNGAHVVCTAHDSIEMKNDSEVRQPVQRESKTNKTKTFSYQLWRDFYQHFRRKNDGRKKKLRNEMKRRKEKKWNWKNDCVRVRDEMMKNSNENIWTRIEAEREREYEWPARNTSTFVCV